MSEPAGSLSDRMREFASKLDAFPQTGLVEAEIVRSFADYAGALLFDLATENAVQAALIRLLVDGGQGSLTLH